ncbi:MAG: aminoglycoside phosphotransferase family protein [Hyphomicrobiales bacterium]
MSACKPDSADFYKEKWCLESCGPKIETPTGMLYPVVRAGSPLMLKIAKRDSDEQHGFDVLNHYGGRGAVRIFERDGDAFTMQRAVPGMNLVDFRAKSGDAEATRIAAGVIKTLHSVSGTTKLPDLPQLSILGSAFAAIPQTSSPVLAPRLIEFAKALFERLNASTKNLIVLHGDLHHENMLLDESGGWLAIDPKGFLGDPVYDCAALFKNPLGDESVSEKACILSRGQLLADHLDYPIERILQWAFVHCALSVIWSLQDDVPTGPALPVVLALYDHLQGE